MEDGSYEHASSSTLPNDVNTAQSDTLDVSTSSPISVLPPEILSLILDIAYDPQNVDDNINIPVVASHVSQFWRGVALSNPLLWSYITISPPWRFSWIQACLHRSKECPLDLRIAVHIDYYTAQEEERPLAPLRGYEALRDILLPNYYRCRSIHAQGVFLEACEVLFYLLDPLHDLSMPHLEELIIDGEDEDEDNPVPVVRKSMTMFSSAPKLLDVSLGGFGLVYYSPPLTGITTLHLSAAKRQIPYRRFAQILESCTCLSFLAVYDDLLTDWPGVSSICHVPLLESLFILGNMLSVSELLLFLSAPKLRELLIAPVIAADVDLLHDHRSSTQTPRFPLLSSLTLAPAHPDAFGALQSLSDCFPSITRLTLANMYKDQFSAVFRAVEPIIFPRLAELAITDVREDILEKLISLRYVRSQPAVVYIDTTSMERIRRSGYGWQLKHLKQLSGVREGNLWETLRRRALYSDSEDRFVGILPQDDDE